MKASTIVNKKIQKILIGFIWLGIWQIAYWMVGKAVLIPSPYNTLKTLFSMLGQITFYKLISTTFIRVLLGVALSFMGAVFMAIASYKSHFVKLLLKPMVAFMKSTPIMAIIILALLWFESDDVPIFVCILMCYPIIYTNLLTGLFELDDGIKELNKIYHVPKGRVIKKCYWPQLQPYVLASLELGMGMAWKVVIAAEVLALPKYAIGKALFQAKVYIETTEVFAWILVIVLLSEACEKMMALLLKKGGRHD